MSEEEFGAESGMNRRDLIKRGAMIGGAVVWTAPMVQSIGGVALATHGSPHDGCDCLSYVILFFTLAGSNQCYQVKYEGQAYTPECGGRPSQDDARCQTYTNALATCGPVCPVPGDALSSGVCVNGTLTITLPTGANITGYVAHDAHVCSSSVAGATGWTGATYGGNTASFPKPC